MCGNLWDGVSREEVEPTVPADYGNTNLFAEHTLIEKPCFGDSDFQTVVSATRVVVGVGYGCSVTANGTSKGTTSSGAGADEVFTCDCTSRIIADDGNEGVVVTTVAVDAVSGIAGFVFPGDRVDVLVIHKVDKPGLTPLEMELLDDEEKKELIIETILTNIKVVAADQRSSVNNEEGILVPSSVSLEVTPEDAQRLKLAADVGTISLALRSIKDKDTVESVALLRATELSQLSASAPQTPRKVGNVSLPVTVIRGTQVDDVESKKKKEEEFQQQSAVIQ